MKISENLLPLTAEEVYVNGRLKVNPKTGEVLEKVIASRPIFRAVQGVEPRGEKGRKPRGGLPGEALMDAEEASAAWGDRRDAAEAEGRRRAAHRAKRRLYDLALCNDFDLFVTFTLDADKIDRYDYKPIVRKLGQWLSNRVTRKGLRYVLVPELHKDGALHFHGLINSEAVKLEKARNPKGRLVKDKGGKQVYNVTDWGVGFTTAVFLTGDYAAVCHYIAKYITKGEAYNTAGTIGGRYYFHGGDLQAPIYKPFTAALDAAEVEAASKVEIPEAGLTLFYCSLRP